MTCDHPQKWKSGKVACYTSALSHVHTKKALEEEALLLLQNDSEFSSAAVAKQPARARASLAVCAAGTCVYCLRAPPSRRCFNAAEPVIGFGVATGGKMVPAQPSL